MELNYRKDFPLLANMDVAYLDSAATTFQKPPAVGRAMTEALASMSSPGRGGHPHSTPGRLGDAGYLYHQPAQKYPGHSGLRGNAVYPVRCAATAAGRECAVCVPNGAGARRGRGGRHCGTARWATAPRMFWLPPRQLQRERWTLPRWKPCPMPGCWKL